MSRQASDRSRRIDRRLHRLRTRAFPAREMVIVEIAEAALSALVVNLEIEHPTLDELPGHWGPPSLLRARSLARLARRSLRAIDEYRRAVDDAIFDQPAADDYPF